MSYLRPIIIKRCGDVAESESGLDFDDLALYDTDENGEIIKMDLSPDQVYKLIMDQWYRDINCFMCQHNDGIHISKSSIKANCALKGYHVPFFDLLTGKLILYIDECYPVTWTEPSFVYRKERIPEEFEIMDTRDDFALPGKPCEKFIITADHVIGCFRQGSAIQRHFTMNIHKHNPQTIEITKRFFNTIKNDPEFPDLFAIGNSTFRKGSFKRALWMMEGIDDDLVMRFTFQNGIPRDGHPICELEIEGDTLVICGCSNDQNILSPRQNKMGYWYQEPFFTVDLESFWNGIENG
jgi:hypothetical protein